MVELQQSTGAVFGDVRDIERPGVHIKVEKNTRGFNWSVSADGETVQDAMAKIDEAVAQLRRRFGE